MLKRMLAYCKKVTDVITKNAFLPFSVACVGFLWVIWFPPTAQRSTGYPELAIGVNVDG